MQKDPWQCPYCYSYDISIYGDNLFCNSCLRTSKVAVMYTDLDLK